jgi:hypothetical protein
MRLKMESVVKLTTIVLGLLIAAVASPVLAKESRNSRPGFHVEGVHIGATRAAAVHECSLREAKFLDRLWGVTEVSIYRACMAEHGQIE